MAQLKDFGRQGFNYEIAREYLKGKTIEFSRPPFIGWSKVMPYDEPEDIARISNESYMYRVAETSITLCVAYDYDNSTAYVDETEAAMHNIRITFDEYGNPISMTRIEGGCLE